MRSRFMNQHRLRTLTEHLTAYAFLTPALVLLGAFGLFPLGYAFYVSLHKWRYKKGAFLGFANFVKAVGRPDMLGQVLAGVLLVAAAYFLWRRATRADKPFRTLLWLVGAAALLGAGCFLVMGVPGLLRTGDVEFYTGLKLTVFYAVFSIPGQLVLALLISIALFNLGTRAGLLRLVYFLPYITPMIASAVVFRSLFSPDERSVANRVLALVGSAPLGWLCESDSIVRLLLQAWFHTPGPDWVNTAFPSLAMISVVLYGGWVYVGYDTVILLAGLSAVPRELYEAAELDGAGSWAVLRNVTLPLLSPTLFFLSMISVIGTFRAFNHIYIMRTASARGTLDTTALVIFDTFFKGHNASYASAMALCLFVVILGVSLLQNRIAKNLVFYG